ncbi:232_t:CDS:1, partial [Cetraspora pellucida]
KIVKLKIGLEIVNLIANLNISQRNYTLFEAKRKKKILNNTASEFLIWSLSESSNNDEDFIVNVIK